MSGGGVYETDSGDNVHGEWIEPDTQDYQCLLYALESKCFSMVGYSCHG